ncbi:MAG TPA: hypothetical protein VKV25_02715, partial [Acidimicrobiales bacterium]|nr:hypothetical protein [Acidimicrobiales bacterium]
MASGFFRKTMVFLGLDDEELDDYDSGYEPEVSIAPQAPRRMAPEPPEPTPAPQPLTIRPIPRDSGDPSGGMSTPSPRRTVMPLASPKVHVVAPSQFSDGKEIADRFKSNQP